MNPIKTKMKEGGYMNVLKTVLVLATISALFMWGCGGRVTETPPGPMPLEGSVPVSISVTANSGVTSTGVTKDVSIQGSGHTEGEADLLEDTGTVTCSFVAAATTSPAGIVQIVSAPLDCSGNLNACLRVTVTSAGGECYADIVGFIPNTALNESILGTLTFNYDFGLAVLAIGDSGFRADLSMADFTGIGDLGVSQAVLNLTDFDADVANPIFDLTGCNGSGDEATVSLVDWGVVGPPDTRDFLIPWSADPATGRKNLTVAGISAAPPSVCLIKQAFNFDQPLYDAVMNSPLDLRHGPINSSMKFCSQKTLTCAAHAAGGNIAAPAFIDPGTGLPYVPGSILSVMPNGAQLNFAEAMDLATVITGNLYIEATGTLPANVAAIPSQVISVVGGSGDANFLVKYQNSGGEQTATFYQNQAIRIVATTNLLTSSNKNLADTSTLSMISNDTLSDTFISEARTQAVWDPSPAVPPLNAVTLNTWPLIDAVDFMTVTNTVPLGHYMTVSDALKAVPADAANATIVKEVVAPVVSAWEISEKTDNLTGFASIGLTGIRDYLGFYIQDKEAGADVNDAYMIGVMAVEPIAALQKCVVVYIDYSAAAITTGNAVDCVDPQGFKLTYYMGVIEHAQWVNGAGVWTEINGAFEGLLDLANSAAFGSGAKEVGIAFNSADVALNNDNVGNIYYDNFTNLESATLSYEEATIVP